jgi:hypothetical protein
MAMNLEEYRAALEACLAHHIIEYHKMRKGPHCLDAHRDTFFWQQIDGMCVAMRLIPGYADTDFNLAWATDPTRPKVDWQGIIDHNYCT